MYIDTSLLVPYYCPEALSRAAERTLRGDPRPAVSDLVEVEFRTGLYARIAVQRRHYEAAPNWLARFTVSRRALDALHLALADVEGLRLATADQDLSRSARSLGVAVTLVRA